MKGDGKKFLGSSINAMQLEKMNGDQRMDTGEKSSRCSRINQKVMQNTMSGVQQRTANLMQT